MGTKTIHVSLPEALKEYANKRVGEGQSYGTLSDYIRSLIREDQKHHGEERLKQLLLEGIHSGPPIEMTRKEWNKLWIEADERVQGRKQKP
ncbi:MAG: type II toxin-antitoxin system ParD family antitoxin [Pseudomonadota bacterium]|nr:type II toxin-antitoxin system ParD family antitoxin [Pseudomonadota bacterium]